MVGWSTAAARCRSLTLLVSTVACGLLGWAGGVAASPAAPAVSASATPALSIAIDNGRTTAGEGDRFTYTVKLRNIGGAAARGVQVITTLPAGVRLVSASKKATTGAGRVSWLTNVAAGGTATFTATVVVGELPASMLRLASVACARTAGSAKPMVCATHTDLLPAGLAQTQAQQRRGSGANKWWWSLAALASLLSLGVVALPAPRRWLTRSRWTSRLTSRWTAKPRRRGSPR